MVAAVIAGVPARGFAACNVIPAADRTFSSTLGEVTTPFAGPGDTVHSVGNSGVLVGKLWRYTAGKVRSVYQAESLTTDSLLKARIIETQSPINAGDSGGPLVNDRGELVGVVNSTQKQASLVSFNVDVSEVRAFLAEVRGPPKAPTPADAPGTDRQSPPVLGSWKVTLITLEGEHFQDGCLVGFDGRDVVATFDSSKRITVVPPPHSAGVVEVRVVNPDGGVDVKSQAFEYVLPPAGPAVVAVRPNKGSILGGTTIIAEVTVSRCAFWGVWRDGPSAKARIL